MMQSRLPGPPGIFPDLADAMVDLNTVAGVDLVKAQWRYHDAEIETRISEVSVMILNRLAHQIVPMMFLRKQNQLITMIHTGNLEMLQT